MLATKRISIPVLLCCCHFMAWAQQPLITNDSYLTWTRLSPAYGIRNDGQYVWYQYGSPATGDVLVLRSADDKLHREFPRGFNPAFSGNSFFFQLPGDTLAVCSADSITYLPDVIHYTIEQHQLLLQKPDTLIWMDLNTGRSNTIHTGEVSQIAFNGQQLAFITGRTLRYYQPDVDSVRTLHDSCTGPLQFSRDRKRIICQLLPAKLPSRDEIRIWHYHDYYLQRPPPVLTTVVIRLEDAQVLSVNVPGTQIAYQDGGRYIITQNSLNYQEYYWNKTVISTLYLVDTHTGERKAIAANKDNLLIQPAISPGERFMTWLDPSSHYIRCYEIATGHTRDLLKGIEVAQWTAGDSAVFIHTAVDVWQVDPTGQKPAVNMTGGKQRHTIFRLLFPGIFVAFDTKTKQNGFWRWRHNSLAPCTMDDCLYYWPQYPLDQYKPLKAKDTTIYLLSRMEATESPNLLLTDDFSRFTRLTNIRPEAAYNWLTVELTKAGLLYKPANFNPQQKYPIIFHYYERSKDYLHRYLPPALSEGSFNVATYVSNGYIVCIPDIRTKKGRPGSSAAKAVLRAAKYLSAFPWVDRQKMGLQGHSFGGYITNYIITHSDLFAAAQASAGPVNFFSGYGAIRKITGTAMQQLYEQGQNKMGVTPWDRPRLYRKNSPVIRANKVHTPLLLMHNDNDNAVPFAQGIELFTALRRLQRPVWLIQYKDEGHQLFRDPQKLDFTVRQQQFFDHYLKGKPAPDWMKDH
ncbi:prolyl oligopeptidase family serine peptidase [Chitinophaga filiformis]|uniref:alpha/beta hydrolase family protein n=1 Tax=Chitinophaga filiformis TaxID=104663 RepID=UPI001F3E47DF|nr:prolyl oligopeptidase family serine peptidase [Chitinophaga filiformis]MCF6401251.1 prolyl oligopeptidase family serine peptidase [Chitinophaga filiformis]